MAQFTLVLQDVMTEEGEPRVQIHTLLSEPVNPQSCVSSQAISASVAVMSRLAEVFNMQIDGAVPPAPDVLPGATESVQEPEAQQAPYDEQAVTLDPIICKHDTQVANNAPPATIAISGEEVAIAAPLVNISDC